MGKEKKKKKASPPTQPASPPTPLRVERGVNSTVCQGFTAMKEGKRTNADYTL